MPDDVLYDEDDEDLSPEEIEDLPKELKDIYQAEEEIAISARLENADDIDPFLDYE